MISRRKFLADSGAVAGSLALHGLLPAWAQSAVALSGSNANVLSGTEFDLRIARTSLRINGRDASAITVNGGVPAPLLRWREGDTVTIRVHNALDAHTSIHWHGILLPFQMDGVPGISFPGIAAGETFTYQFPLKQNGTYWYHSHSGLQEQIGHYGPIIIEPRAADPVAFDREYVVVLSDWTYSNPHHIFAKLKKHSDFYNVQQRTLGEFISDADEQGLRAAFRERMMWGAMRMNATDIADVTGSEYTYLINGHGPADNWTALFAPGERVRLRVINASAMTFFNVRIPGLPMTVVQADGLNVMPVETDEFQIGVAETYDVVIAPDEKTYALVAEASDRSGMVTATLSSTPGQHAVAPPLRERPTLTMKDMAMDHAGMDHGSMKQGSMEHSSMEEGAMEHSPMNNAAGDHSMHAGMKMPDSKSLPQRHDHATGPGVAGLAMSPNNRLDEPGAGLDNVPHRTLTYRQLRAREHAPDSRAPGRELELHLTSNMERYMWSFDGVKFSDVIDPIVFREGERLRLTLVNDTMMAHPIHLHGMFFEVVTGQGPHDPRKHTVIVKPGEILSIDITADAPGDWAFHCHLLYHMHAGMMQVVSVRPGAT